MKRFKFLSFIVVFTLLGVATGCKKSSTDATPTSTLVNVSGDLTGTVNWTANNQYLIQGTVTVAGVLNIEAGTIIKGEKASKGTLVILRGGRINAIGTANNPIVFTSNQPAGQRAAGDWGGVIICGNAPVNQNPLPVVEGGITYQGQPVQYGRLAGDAALNADDNSGTMRYCRIEFSGIPLTPNNETNGLTLCAVGRGTTLEYIQVSFSGDDSYEWFGGTVNAKWLVAYRGLDDDFDTDFGFSGNVQFGLGIRDPQISDQSGSNGFESDNDAQGSTNTPQTSAIFSNMTIIGPGTPDGFNIAANFNYGAHLRRNTAQRIFNSLLCGYRWGVVMESSTTHTNYNTGIGRFRNNIIARPLTSASTPFGSIAVTSMSPVTFSAPVATSPSGAPFDTQANMLAFFQGTPSNNIQATAPGPFAGSPSVATAPFLDAIVGLNRNVWTLGSTPTLLPVSGSILTSSPTNFTDITALNPNPSSFFTSVNYVGAFGTTDWTQGWTNWNPQQTPY